VSSSTTTTWPSNLLRVGDLTGVSPIELLVAGRSAVFMHCLPARRGAAVAASVIDGSRSVVWEQAVNRVPAEQAVIYALSTATREAGR
jgi:aspartate carbamoyltransferase catalytic subunit